MERYNFKIVEEKWQKFWDRNKIFKSKIIKDKKKKGEKKKKKIKKKEKIRKRK